MPVLSGDSRALGEVAALLSSVGEGFATDVESFRLHCHLVAEAALLVPWRSVQQVEELFLGSKAMCDLIKKKIKKI